MGAADSEPASPTATLGGVKAPVRTSWVLIPLLMALALTSGGCSDSGDQSKSQTPTTRKPTATTAVPAQSTKMTPSKVLAADLQYATFAAIVKKSGLSAEIDKAKNLTIFAPNEAAFKAFGKDATKQALDSVTSAKELVTQHVVADRLDLTQLINRTKPLQSLNGAELEIRFDPKKPTAQAGTLPLTVGGESVTTVEIPTDSGYIHVITGVIPAT